MPGTDRTISPTTTVLLLVVALPWLITGCMGMPTGIQPVENFDSARYLGRWYEIARLDHFFERGLEEVTATYTPRDDGGVTVLNRGFNTEAGEWQEAKGRAYFVDSSTEGYLKVSFFGPFYASYVVFELDPDYGYAFVSGFNTSYLWLLARQPTVDASLIARFKERAESLGFDTSRLIFPRQSH